MMGRITRRGACALVVLVAAFATSIVGAPTASAAFMEDPCTKTDTAQFPCDVRVDGLVTYKGWAHVDVGLYCGGMNPGQDYIDSLRAPRPAWRWTGSAWTRASLATSTQVYVWPYATGWSWVWTQRTGWLAMQDEHLVINPRFNCYWPYGPPPAAAR